MKSFYGIFFLLVACLCGFSQSVKNSPHDLSVGSSAELKSIAGGQVCGYCHTPHSSDPQTPAWAIQKKGQIYTPYTSATLQAVAGQPDGASLMCLSCHDGTIAPGGVGIGLFHKNKKANLSLDLSDDHPVSFIYDNSLVATDKKLHSPDKRWVDGNSKVQCTSCHDPHDNTKTKFLKEGKEYGILCKQCHNVSDNWASSVHLSSGKHIQLTDGNKRSLSISLEENACSNCHRSHNAESKPLLTNKEEDVCLDCHNGSNNNAANIGMQLQKHSSHNVKLYSDIHFENENIGNSTKHVECGDCHNHHEMGKSIKSEQAPFAKSSIQFVPGINITGNLVSSIVYEYELCFKCHSINSMTQSTVTREYNSNNLRSDFLPSNISFHPVAGTRNNPEVRSLLPHLTSSSYIYCSDCHSGNDSQSGRGPHGSSYKHLLKNFYNRSKAIINGPKNITSNFLETQYALCAECHNMHEVLNTHNQIANGHFMKYTTCNTCHDPHGFEGGTTENNSFLINLDSDVTRSNENGPAKITMQGNGKVSCNFNCHDVTGGTVFQTFNHLNASQ